MALEEHMNRTPRLRDCLGPACVSLVLVGLSLTSFYSYVLFHSLAEVFSIVVAGTIFSLTWYSRRWLDNHAILLLGISSLFVGGVDLIHTLAYKGMGVFPGDNANLATQLWIAARSLQSVAFLLAPLYVTRRFKPHAGVLVCGVATAFLLGSIFWGVFPDCYVEGVGLTPFKKVSEYVISLVLAASLVFLVRKRGAFEQDVLRWLVLSIALTIGGELAFTAYVSVYGLSNLVGHLFKILAFYLLYKAIVETGLARPYDLLFRELKQSEEALRAGTRWSGGWQTARASWPRRMRS